MEHFIVLFLIFFFFIFIVFAAVINAIVLAFTILPRNCLAYRNFVGGAGEMNYCVINPEDDDLEFSFYQEENNTLRYDSTVYLLTSPVTLIHENRTIESSFDNKVYNVYHYFFENDTITGTVKCSSACFLNIVSQLNDCRTPWNYSLSKRTRSAYMTVGDFDDHDYEDPCPYYYSTLLRKEITSSGTIEFDVKILKEGPSYVYVSNQDKEPSGSITYTLNQTKIDTSKAFKKCNNYTCFFTGLANYDRTKKYVGVNVFSDNLTGSYQIIAKYRPSKAKNDRIALGFGITTGALFVIAILASVIIVVCSRSSHKKNKNGNVYMNYGESEEMQTTDGYQAPKSSQTPGSYQKLNDKDVDPLPDYSSLGF